MDSFFSDFAAYAPWLCWGKRPPRGGDRDDDGIDHAPFPQLKAAMPLPILVWFFFLHLLCFVPLADSNQKRFLFIYA